MVPRYWPCSFVTVRRFVRRAVSLLRAGCGKAGGPTAARIVTARRETGVQSHGPPQTVTVARMRSGGGYGRDHFTVDWDQQHVTCPNGATSTQWAL